MASDGGASSPIKSGSSPFTAGTMSRIYRAEFVEGGKEGRRRRKKKAAQQAGVWWNISANIKPPPQLSVDYSGMSALSRL